MDWDYKLKPGNQVVTFSVKPSDTEGKKLIFRLKGRSAQSTVSFSDHVLKALKAYEKEKWPTAEGEQ